MNSMLKGWIWAKQFFVLKINRPFFGLKFATFLLIKSLMPDKKWLAVYTRPRYEKRINEILNNLGIECYLPLIKTLKQWSDRKKWVELPLFSSYVFVKIDEKNYYDVLNIPGTVKYVSFEGKAVEIPEKVIEEIKWLLSKEIEIVPHNEILKKGDKVEIVKGPLKGLLADLIEFNKKQRIILRLDGIDRMIEIQISLSHVRPV